jgi:hypothetical protein
MTVLKTENKTHSYTEYRAFIDAMREKGMATGGNSSEDYLRYTDLNNNRMDKWDKRYELSPELKSVLDNLEQEEEWLVLSEGWCGDAAHALPIMAKVAAYADKIRLKVLFRDENLEIMDQYLTNGGRSIPKLIRFNTDGDLLGTWGPRPLAARQIMEAGKAAGQEKAEINIDLQKWYARDRGLSTSQELAEMLKS